MNEFNKTVIILTKCGSTHKTFGMRTEQLNRSHWRVTWAFPIKETVAKNEGYDKTIVKGRLEFSTEYPGCPFCGGNQVSLCTNCGHLTCTHLINGIQVCEWCGFHGRLEASKGDLDIAAGIDT